MTHRSVPILVQKSAAAIVALGSSFLVLGCPKSPPPTVDAGPPVAVVEPPDAAPTELVPLVTDDAGADAGVDAGHKAGPGVSPLQARVKACCASLQKRAKELGASPEASQVAAMASTCNTLAAGLGNSGTVAPELAGIKAMLKGVPVTSMPALCTGL